MTCSIATYSSKTAQASSAVESAVLVGNRHGSCSVALAEFSVKRVSLYVLSLVVGLGAVGCAGRFERIDARIADVASHGLVQNSSLEGFAFAQNDQSRSRRNERGRDDYLEFEAEDELEEEEGDEGGSVILGEMIAVFPGMLWHGAGHYYARDYESSRRLRSIGEWGYLLGGIGGGLILGGIAIQGGDPEFSGGDLEDHLATSFYVAGGIVGAIGLFYFLTAWGGDIYDTPRAVRENGRSWQWLQERGDLFDW